MKTTLQSLRLLLVLTALTGLGYPLAVTGLARALFPYQAGGSVGPHGSTLLAQKTESARYFWPRPSAGDYATVPSGSSNLAPGSDALAKSVAERRAKFGDGAPVDLLTASGSGLDPHLSPAAAQWQAPRVAAARGLELAALRRLIDQKTAGPQFGCFGEPTVNVLALNQALDQAK